MYNAIPIKVYNIVQTGPKSHPGGLNEGLLIVGYQVCSEDLVEIEPSKPVNQHIKIAAITCNASFLAPWGYISPDNLEGPSNLKTSIFQSIVLNRLCTNLTKTPNLMKEMQLRGLNPIKLYSSLFLIMPFVIVPGLWSSIFSVCESVIEFSGLR